MDSSEPENRVDIFISFHGSEDLSGGFTTRELASATKNAVYRSATNLGRRPSIFFDSETIQDRLDVIFDAVLQTRPGGVALFLLTPKFFTEEWCVAELRAFLDVHLQSYVKLRFVCLDSTPNDILDCKGQKSLVPEISGFTLRSNIPVTTKEEKSVLLSNIVLDALECKGDISPRNLPTLLGQIRLISFFELQKVFTEDDIAAI